MTTPVIWLNLDAEAAVRGYWDQGLLDLAFAGEVWRLRRSYEHIQSRHEDEVPALPGAVVVLPGRFHAEPELVARVNRALERLGWVLLIVSSDEESLFPIEQLRHPRLRLWVMTPRAGRRYPEGVRFLGEGYAADTPAVLRKNWWKERPIDIGFAGQITHERREVMRDQLDRLERTSDWAVASVFTKSFTAGLERPEYLALLASTRVAPAPCGPATPDSFRFFEALEAGCVPLADSRCDGQPEGYWNELFSGLEPLPFPVVSDWNDLEHFARLILGAWPADANRCSAWWQQYKRRLVLQLEADIDALEEYAPDVTLGDLISVVVPTSPIPSHPSIDVIRQTLDSVQERLPDSEIIVVSDGVRPEQAERAGVYEEYRQALLWHLNHERRNCLPILLPEHQHQANACRRALQEIDSPTMLFVEHDTPLVGDIPFQAIADVVITGEANLVRLHHEASVLEPHRHLMLDHDPRDVMGVPLLATVQWSQRPHLASTAFYRHIIRRYFGTASRTMIEDVMHGVVQQAERDGGWGMFRLFMYAPPGDIKRSTHLDGRDADPKFDMVIEFDDGQPEWAPMATSAREAARRMAEENQQPAAHEPAE